MILFAFDGAEDLLPSWCDGLLPDPALTVSEWADRHRILSSRASAGKMPSISLIKYRTRVAE